MRTGKLWLAAVALASSLLMPITAAQDAPSRAKQATKDAADQAKKSTTQAANAAKSDVTGQPTQADIDAAKAQGKVWVNTETGVYHKSGRYFGHTKNGKFMTEEEAKKAGYHAAKNDKQQ